MCYLPTHKRENAIDTAEKSAYSVRLLVKTEVRLSVLVGSWIVSDLVHATPDILHVAVFFEAA